MESAFGIDHGDELSKARLPRSRMPRTRARAGVPSQATRIKGSLNRLGEKDISVKEIGRGAGSTVSRVGGFMQRHPGLTGTTLVGGGGAAGYKLLSDTQGKKKR
jgi:hypothetical protein